MDGRNQALPRLVYMRKDARGKGGAKRGDSSVVKREEFWSLWRKGVNEVRRETLGKDMCTKVFRQFCCVLCYVIPLLLLSQMTISKELCHFSDAF